MTLTPARTKVAGSTTGVGIAARSATGGQPTGTSAGAVSDYAPPALDETRALSLSVDYMRTASDLRTEADLIGGEVQEIHSEARERDLNARTLEKSKKSVSSLLDELANERGMGWSDIAEVLGVSVSAIRKWRKGGDASSASRRRLAQIAALLDVLEQKPLIEDPAGWIEIDLPLGTGYYIRPLDLIREGHDSALLEIAEQRQPIERVLDDVRPNWRASRSDFEVFLDVDTQRSIRRRES